MSVRLVIAFVFVASVASAQTVSITGRAQIRRLRQ
jgi:hypothetical protein